MQTAIQYLFGPGVTLGATTNGASKTLLPKKSPLGLNGVDTPLGVPNSTGFQGSLAVFLDVTAASGTAPTLDVVVQGQAYPGGAWTTLQPLAGSAASPWTQATTTGQQTRRYEGPIPQAIRGVATIGGTTPSFTFTLTALCGDFGG